MVAKLGVIHKWHHPKVGVKGNKNPGVKRNGDLHNFKLVLEGREILKSKNFLTPFMDYPLSQFDND